MKPRIRLRPCLFSQNASSAISRPIVRSQRQNATTSSSSSSSSSPQPPKTPPSPRLWLRLTLVTVTAAGIGAYIKWSQDSKTSSTLNPFRFTKYHLVSRESVSSTGSLFTLEPVKSDGSNLAVYDAAWKSGVWSVMFKQPQLQIGRDYTPLPPTSADGDDECLRFFIRKDAFGEVSRYLHSLKIGAPIEVRGPRVECEIPSDINTVLFIAGGTGIAPALQAGHTLLQRTDAANKPKIHILWANRHREDCKGGRSDSTDTGAKTQSSWLSRVFKSSGSVSVPASTEAQDVGEPSLIVRELEALKARYPEQVTVQYFVDEERQFIGKKPILDCTNTASSSESNNRNMILVSGPEGFISYMAGPKLWAQGMELQGPLRGVIKELDLKDWAVYKL
ncbi:hypothetical protein BDV18DRAFT_148606 [Aspergillus unguis]